MTCTAATNSAPNSRYSTASEAMTAISDKALLIGWLCTSRLIAPATQIAPNTENKIKCNMNQFSVPVLGSQVFSISTENGNLRTSRQAVNATTNAVITRFATASGNKNFHPKAISWSYRKRGSVPRTQMYRIMKQKTFATNQNTGRIACRMGGPKIGPCQPPRKSSVARHPTVIMFAYSAMKNMANFMALYSVWYPATSSVSASGRSKGMRFVSA